MSEEPRKEAVQEYWETEPCGSRELDEGDRRAFFDQHEKLRYEYY